MQKKKDEITIHNTAAEYLTYVAAVGDNADSVEMRYENENILRKYMRMVNSLKEQLSGNSG